MHKIDGTQLKPPKADPKPTDRPVARCPRAWRRPASTDSDRSLSWDPVGLKGNMGKHGKFPGHGKTRSPCFAESSTLEDILVIESLSYNVLADDALKELLMFSSKVRNFGLSSATLSGSMAATASCMRKRLLRTMPVEARAYKFCLRHFACNSIPKGRKPNQKAEIQLGRSAAWPRTCRMISSPNLCCTLYMDVSNFTSPRALTLVFTKKGVL